MRLRRFPRRGLPTTAALPSPPRGRTGVGMRSVWRVALFSVALFGVASAQQPPADPPGVCNAFRTQWADVLAAGEHDGMQSFLSRVPPSCRQLRAQVERNMASRSAPQRRPPTASPPAGAVRRSERDASAGLSPGQRFRDCDDCPEMVIIPAGSFMMGSPEGEEGRDTDEGPQRRISVRAFAAGRFEITQSQWQACVDRAGCTRNPTPTQELYIGANRPVMGVDWEDATQYVQWLSARTGRPYRLPSEAEWEYAARAGSSDSWPWGRDGRNYSAACQYFHYPSECHDFVPPPERYPYEVDRFRPNLFGLYSTHTNANEWVQDCYRSTLPTSSAAFDSAGCSQRVKRGGSCNWGDPVFLRVALRHGSRPTDRWACTGFRVVRDT